MVLSFVIQAVPCSALSSVGMVAALFFYSVGCLNPEGNKKYFVDICGTLLAALEAKVISFLGY